MGATTAKLNYNPAIMSVSSSMKRSMTIVVKRKKITFAIIAISKPLSIEITNDQDLSQSHLINIRSEISPPYHSTGSCVCL